VLYPGSLQAYQGIGLRFTRTLAAVQAAKLIVVGGTPEEIGRYRDEAELHRTAAACRKDQRRDGSAKLAFP
jgi:hypothetical protein